MSRSIQQYSARIWIFSSHALVARSSLIKAQTSRETIATSDHSTRANTQAIQSVEADDEDMFHRSALVLGLDVMRSLMHDQVISIIGVGGLGSVVAEHLIHMGFQTLNLIDPDVLEVSNLNRVVGAYYKDAQQKRSKVEVVKRHLTKINPNAKVQAYEKDVHDKKLEEVLALSDWLIVATDNHSSRIASRRRVQVPFTPQLRART